MRILALRLHGFGQFNRGLDVSFAPDRLNVIVGRNEAGKSTLINAVGGVLFGFRDLNMVRKYEPWEEHDRYAADATFLLDDGRRVRVERDFRAGTARIVEILDDGAERTLFSGSADPRGSKAEDALYFDVLGELVGFQDEAVFRNTLFVGQSGLKAEVSEQIRRLLTGSGDVDYKGALHELHGRRAELTADNPWRAKASSRKKTLELAREATESAERALHTAEDDLRRLAEVEDALAVEESRRGAETEAVATLRATSDAYRAAAAAARARRSSADRLKETTRSTEQARKLRATVEDCGEQVRRRFAAHHAHGDGLLDVLSALKKERVELERAATASEEAEAALGSLVQKPNAPLGAGLGGGLFVALAAAGAVSGLLAPGLIAGAAFGAFGWTLGRKLGTGFAEKKARLSEAAREAARALADRRRAVDDLEAKTGSLLVGREIDELAEEHRAYLRVMEEGRRAQASLKGLGEIATIEAAHAEAEREARDADAAWAAAVALRPELKSKEDPAVVAGEAERLAGELAAAMAKADRTRTRIEELRVELARRSATPEVDFAKLRDEAREGRATTRDLDFEKDALKEAIDMLDACIKEFRENDVFRLADDMSRIFAKLTGDKYVRVQLGASLEPAASTSDRSGIAPEDLSQGAHDQLYFAMRMAVVRHLARRETPPLFLDDPFVNFDAQRLAAAKSILSGMSDHQCVMSTCDRQYASWSDAVIDLDAARAATAPSE